MTRQAPRIFNETRILSSPRLSLIVLFHVVLLGACQPDTVLSPLIRVAPRPTNLLPDAGTLGVPSPTNPAVSVTLTTYSYRTAVSMRIGGDISMTSNHAYYSSYSGPLDGHGILASTDCYAYVAFTY